MDNDPGKLAENVGRQRQKVQVNKCQVADTQQPVVAVPAPTEVVEKGIELGELDKPTAGTPMVVAGKDLKGKLNTIIKAKTYCHRKTTD